MVKIFGGTIPFKILGCADRTIAMTLQTLVLRNCESRGIDPQHMGTVGLSHTKKTVTCKECRQVSERIYYQTECEEHRTVLSYELCDCGYTWIYNEANKNFRYTPGKGAVVWGPHTNLQKVSISKWKAQKIMESKLIELIEGG